MRKLFIVVLSFGILNSCGTSKSELSQKSKIEKTDQKENQSKVSPVKDDSDTKDKIIERPRYNASATILTDLQHTKLEVAFNWEKSQLNGTATLTCSPHFYATDSLILDAKAMEILSVKLNDEDLSYKYNDANFLRIKLDREYSRDESYTLVIDYIAKPEEKKEGGSSAISSDKGLYFINPKGENENQMPHIWTQGETEASSVWFPTIDRPNQNTTQEIFITVEDKYKTLSNGEFISSTQNGDGTRTDYWKQDLPHVPYLFMMAVGEFSVVEDTYTKPDGTVIPVHYYVEPEWEEHAQAIFGETPEMIAYFSELLDVDYKWDKYHQVVVREYVSGAMENTGAVVFGDFVYKTKRELLDANDHSIIAHELFHHWFGNLVTCESWSNLPLNEAFANYSQYLWDEHHSGRDHADYVAEKEADGYFRSSKQSGHHDMIWFDYQDKEDMFDAHSYNKGGRILHMLRYYLGDDAFFEGLKKYLNDNAFSPVEIHHLRLAFEEVSGEDLNWFFEQWFLSPYHPKIKISQEVNDGEVTIKIKQIQDLEKAPLYKLPLKIGVYANGSKTSHQVVLNKNINEFTFSFEGELENIIVDEDRTILGVFNHDKPREWYIHQYYNAPLYKDREKAITYGSRLNSDASRKMIKDALNDDFWYIQKLATTKIEKLANENRAATNEKLVDMAKNAENSKVRAAAIEALGTHFFTDEFKESSKEIFIKAIKKDSSYLVISSSLNSLTKGDDADIQKALSLAKGLENERSSALKSQIIGIYKDHGSLADLDFMVNTIKNAEISGGDMISSILNLTTFYNKQEVKARSKYLSAYEELSENGGAYVTMVLPMAIMEIYENTNKKIDSLSAELERLEKAGKSGEATLVQGKLEKENNFKNEVITLIQKLQAK